MFCICRQYTRSEWRVAAVILLGSIFFDEFIVRFLCVLTSQIYEYSFTTEIPT